MDLSIVIPVFNERTKIGRDLAAAAAFLVGERLNGEIIVVDDGSRDHTREVVEAANVPTETQLLVIGYETHRGKGFAVRAGIKVSKGRNVMFADSGSCVPYRYALAGLQMLNNAECDIAHGSRKLKQSRILASPPWNRRLYSALLRRLLIAVMKVPAEFTDTQCGFKIYRGDLARELYGACVTDGFMFDVEIILRALRQQFRIREFPIEWTVDPDSRTTQTLKVRQLLAELLTIKRLLAERK